MVGTVAESPCEIPGIIELLGKYIQRSKVISGATILGNGEVALIIDPNALI